MLKNGLVDNGQRGIGDLSDMDKRNIFTAIKSFASAIGNVIGEYWVWGIYGMVIWGIRKPFSVMQLCFQKPLLPKAY